MCSVCYCHIVNSNLLFQEESIPYTFYVKEREIRETLGDVLEQEKLETEKAVEIVYQPQAVFKVRAVTRCTSTIPGKTIF